MFKHVFKQRWTIFLLALCLVALIAHPTSAATTLGQAGAQSGRIIGVALYAGNLSNSTYSSIAQTQFSGVTPANEMKWDTTEPSPNSFNFGPGDTIANFAASHNMKLRGHTLVWHNQLPNWVSSLSGSSAVTSAMNNHITTEMTHFKGKIWYWDVVNEAFNEDGSRRGDVFQNQIGNGYIETAFRTARAADSSAKLCYNDYNIEDMNYAKTVAVYNMVSDFKTRGVPIDCVGFQSHFIVGQLPGNFQQNLQKFANLGVDVQITELDIRMSTPGSSFNLNTQQPADFATVAKACLAVSRCTDITTWGIGEPDSWIPGTFSGQGQGLLYDQNYQPKPAFTAFLNALSSGGTPLPTNTSVPPTTIPTSVAESPYGGTNWALPGKIEAENFDNGGEGVAYHDNEAANQGGQYRTGDGVDIETTTDNGGGYDVGWTVAGEWLKYMVNVTTSGTYNIDFRVASTSASSFHLEVDGTNVTGTMTLPNTGAWQTFTTVTKSGVNLSAGNHVLRLYKDASNGNFNWINFSLASGPTNTPVPPTNTPVPPTFAPPTNTPVGPTSTPVSGTCTPNATISAPFTFDGVGTLCWKSNNLGSYINDWNLNSLTINGVNLTNLYVASNGLPPKASDGYWYISYNSSVAWGHFEAR